jgi:hypothetical protein
MATTRYLRIEALQTPFDLGLDANGRARVGFNIIAYKVPSTTFEDEVVSILVSANVGVKDKTILIGAGASIPGSAVGSAPRSDIPPSIHITPTGGPAPELVHNQTLPAYHRPTAQIVARAMDFVAARTLAWSAFNALVSVKNTTVTF